MAGAWPERGRREQGGRGGQRRCEEAGRESVRGSGAQASGVGGQRGAGGLSSPSRTVQQQPASTYQVPPPPWGETTDSTGTSVCPGAASPRGQWRVTRLTPHDRVRFPQKGRGGSISDHRSVEYPTVGVTGIKKQPTIP